MKKVLLFHPSCPNWQYCKLGTKKFVPFLLIFFYQLKVYYNRKAYSEQLLRLKICHSHLTCKVANKCLNVHERPEVVEWNKRWYLPFPCCPARRQCPWKKTLIEKKWTVLCRKYLEDSDSKVNGSKTEKNFGYSKVTSTVLISHFRGLLIAIFRRIKCNEEYQITNCCFLSWLGTKVQHSNLYFY